MLDHAKRYAALGWPVFRLTGYKTPLKGSHGFKDATVDANVIDAWWGGGGRVCNIGLATGMGAAPVVVDADGPEGLAELKALAKAHEGLPRTLVAKTGGGWHFYFMAPTAPRLGDAGPGGERVVLKSHNAPRTHKGAPGIDLKGVGGYVVLPPSVNARTGAVYQWVNWGVPIAEMPAWLVDYWLARRAARKAGPPPAGYVGAVAPREGSLFAALGPEPAWLAARERSAAGRALQGIIGGELPSFLQALRRLDANCGYDQWFRIGASIFDFDAGELGLTLFKKWSASAPGYREEADEVACEAKWREYGLERAAGAPVITKATVYGLARDTVVAGEGLGAAVAQSHERATLTATAGVESVVRAAPEQDVFGEAGKVNGHASLPAVMGALPADPLIMLNERYTTIGDVGGKCLVMSWTPSKVDKALKVPSFQSCRTFVERYQHEFVKLGDDVKPLGAAWLKWTRKKYYEGIDLEPLGPLELPGRVLNLWQGFAVEPVEGKWDRLREHIKEVLASGDQEAADYIMRFAAWAVQHPGEPAEAVLVFRGGKGSGKGTFANALKRLFGQHGLQIFNSKHLVGAFNGHLRNCLLLFADEAFWAGDKQGESVLKGMVTEPALMIEQKGIDAAPWKNRLHVVMSANAEWAVPASHDERRYTVLDVSGHRIGDESYFAAVHDEIDNGGLAAMLWDLQRMDLGKWHPRKILHTEALRQQKVHSMKPLDEWWEGVLQTGCYPVSPMMTKHGFGVPAAALLATARDTNPGLRMLSPQAFGRFMNLAGNDGYHSSGGTVWTFQSLAEARRGFARRFGKWKWERVIAEWDTKTG